MNMFDISYYKNDDTIYDALTCTSLMNDTYKKHPDCVNDSGVCKIKSVYFFKLFV